jgi:hypothetical protein
MGRVYEKYCEYNLILNLKFQLKFYVDFIILLTDLLLIVNDDPESK